MLHTSKISAFALGLGLLLAACSGEDKDDTTATGFALTSPGLTDGQVMPDEYTCTGKNFPFSGMPPVDHVMPQLAWGAGPTGTMSYAIVFKDVTLTTATPMDEHGYHWAIYNIPASVLGLPKAMPSGNPIAGVAGAKQYSGALFNDGFIGPCPSWSVAPGSPLLGMMPPPTVSTDSYTFTVFAMPMATIAEPVMRPAPGADAPAISYVRDLDDYLMANALGMAQLHATSSAQPAMFATPP